MEKIAYLTELLGLIEELIAFELDGLNSDELQEKLLLTFSVIRCLEKEIEEDAAKDDNLRIFLPDVKGLIEKAIESFKFTNIALDMGYSDFEISAIKYFTDSIKSDLAKQFKKLKKIEEAL